MYSTYVISLFFPSSLNWLWYQIKQPSNSTEQTSNFVFELAKSDKDLPFLHWHLYPTGRSWQICWHPPLWFKHSFTLHIFGSSSPSGQSAWALQSFSSGMQYPLEHLNSEELHDTWAFSKNLQLRFFRYTPIKTPIVFCKKDYILCLEKNISSFNCFLYKDGINIWQLVQT